MTTAQRVRTVRSRALWVALSSNIGAMFRSARDPEAYSRAMYDMPAPEPSRIEWEDTQ